jgi:hypothetical protein
MGKNAHRFGGGISIEIVAIKERWAFMPIAD